MLQSGFAEKSVPNEYHCATLVGNWQEERATFGAKEAAPATQQLDSTTTYGALHLPFTAAERQGAKTLGCFSAEAPKELLFYHGDITKPERNAIGLDELAWTNRKVETFTNDEMLDMPGVSRKNQRADALTRSMGGSTSSGSGKGTGDCTDRTRALTRETQLLRSMNATTMSATTHSADDNQDPTASGEDGAEASAYRPPSLPPIGRVAERERLLTTKNVTHDATGAYLFDHVEHYPLTSSATIAAMVKSKDNPMHKTKLRIEYQNDS